MTRLLLHGFALLVVLATAATARAEEFNSSDVLAAIDSASSTTGVAYDHLYRVVHCEDPRLDPYAVGDRGTSFGPVQLHRGGNALPAFFAVGYSDPTNPYESIEFLARALRGDFPHLGYWTWSCR